MAKIRTIAGITIENMRKFAHLFFGKEHVHKVCTEPGCFIILLSKEITEEKKDNFKTQFPNVRYMLVVPDNK